MKIEDVLLAVLDGSGDQLIECTDLKDQESKRVQAFHVKRRMGMLAQNVAIQKFSFDGSLFVKVSNKPNLVVWSLKDGIPVKNAAGMSPELKRIISLMREDGQPEEAVQEMISNWKEGNNG